MTPAAGRDPLGEELVKLALAAWPHLPNLVSDYLGPHEWLVESRNEVVPPDRLLAEARSLAARAEREGDAYVAVQAAAIATQIEVEAEPKRYGYVELVEQLLACRFEAPDAGELEELEREVAALAGHLGVTGPDAVLRWESSALLKGEQKWDAALDAYREGRTYALNRFPVPFEERLDIGRTDNPIASLHLTWREPDHMVFEVNVGVPRTQATVMYEVAHNIYPGDYLHMAVLTQRTYGDLGKVAACIKLKNAPENVIAEGIEEVAPYRLWPEPAPEQELAWKLEWLRRGACLTAAVRRRQHGEARTAVLRHLQDMGHMSPARAAQELDRIEHPLWGTYQYTYWLGRRLVQESDRRAGAGVEGARHLGWLYGGLHVPQTFLDTQEVPSGRAAISSEGASSGL